jgi:PPM family protein phosphatase
MNFDYAAVTDTGLIRRRNEDRFVADGETGLFAVVDGMGGHAGGEVASRVVADGVAEFIRQTAFDPEKTWPPGFDPELSNPANRLQVAIRSANRKLADLVSQQQELGHTGATISAALFGTDRLAVSNVGDCRVYLLRDGHAWQITRDHSFVAEQVAMGLLNYEEARGHPLRHVVTRAVSGDEGISVDTWEVRVETGDRILLCSDGLHGMLEDKELSAIASAPDRPLNETCQRLVQAANDKGGSDNATVILIEITNNGETRARGESQSNGEHTAPEVKTVSDSAQT